MQVLETKKSCNVIFGIIFLEVAKRLGVACQLLYDISQYDDCFLRWKELAE